MEVGSGCKKRRREKNVHGSVIVVRKAPEFQLSSKKKARKDAYMLYCAHIHNLSQKKKQIVFSILSKIFAMKHSHSIFHIPYNFDRQ